jgi:large subunit ribosomal protein L10e
VRGRNYRIAKGMPYVRKKYIGGTPVSKITKFTMGNTRGDFSHNVSLLSLKRVQIRHNAIESTRVTVNKILTDKLGNDGYCLWMRVFPHVILRENKMMAFAGADRLQEGMRRSFGKPAGLAARVNVGQVLIDIEVNEEGVEVAKTALKEGMSKLPTTCTIEVKSASKIEAK